MADTLTVPGSEKPAAVPATPATPTAPATVSAEEFNALKTSLERITAAFNASQASQRVAKKSPESIEPDPNANTVSALRAEMKTRQQDIDRGNIALDMRQVIAALKPTAGSDEYIEAYLEKSIAGKVEYDWAQRKTLVTTSDGIGEMKVPLADFIATLDKAGKFNAFKSAPIADRSKPVQGSGPVGGNATTQAEMLQMLADGKLDVTKKYRIQN